MMIQGLLTVFAVTSVCSAAGSTVRMMNSSLTVREGVTVSVCVVATLGPGESVEVRLTSSSDQDLPMPSTTLMLDSNTLTACWTITATDDNVYEDDTEMVTLSIVISSQSGGVALEDPSTTVVTVVDTDEVTVQMPGTVVTVVEGHTARVCASISGAVRERVVLVQLATTELSGERSASSSSDYQSSSINTEFSSTVSEVCLSVQTISENPPIYEYNEVFNVTLSIINPNTNSRVRSGGLTATVRISDQQNAGISMASSSIVQSEIDGDVSVCAQLDSPFGGIEREVFITLTKTSDSSQSYLTFSSGSPMGTTKCLILPVVDDNMFEQSPLLSVTVTLSKTEGHNQGRVDLTSTETVVTVNDDDNVVVTLQTPSPLTRSEGDGDIQVCATLTSPSGGIRSAVTVQLLNALVITFSSPSLMEAVACTDIPNIDNNAYEDDRDLVIQLSPVTERVTAMGSATITVRDDDDVTVSMMRSSITQFENGGDVRVYATLDAPSGGIRKDVPITFTVTRLSTQATTTKTIAFSSGSPQGSQGFITFIVQDNRQFQVTPVAEYTVTLSVPGNSRVSVGSTEMTGVTIDDDDDVTVIIPGSMTYDEGDSDIRVCAQLTSPSGGLAVGQSVTVTFTADGKQPGTMDVTFQSGSIRQHCVTYTVTNDDVYESGPVQTFSVTLSTEQSRVTATGTTTVTVNDDDNPVVALQQLSYSFDESTPEVTGDICVTLEGPAGGLAESIQVQFTISTAGLSRTASFSTDFITAATTQTREFTSSDSVGARKCITVRIIDDDVADPDEMFRVVVTPLTARVSIQGGSSTTITIINDDVLPPPRHLMVDGVTSRSVSLSWDPPESNSFGIRLTGYTVSWKNESILVTESTTMAHITNLIPHQQYQFSVNTNFEEGNFGESVSIHVTTQQDVPTSPPTALSLLSSAATSLTLSWSPPAEPNGVITHYTLYTDYQNGSVSVSTASATLYTLSPLSPYQTVSVEVSANTSVGEGPRTTAVVVTTNEAKSGPVGNLTIIRVNSSTLRVEWTEPADFNGVFQTYIIQVSNDIEYNTTLTQLILHQLAPYTPYEISVSAVNGAGVGETQTVTQFTVEGAPVSHPRDITVTRVSPTSAIVSWTPLTLSEARGFITEYNVTYWREGSDSANGVTVRVPGNESSAIISNLDADSNYLFTVSVGTVKGASNVSEAIIIQGARKQIEGTIVGAVVGTLVTIVIILILGVIFGLIVLYVKRHQPSVLKSEVVSMSEREYEEVKLPEQQFGDVPTQKCEAYGMIERSHPIYSQDPTGPVPCQDPLYEHIS